MDRKYTPGPWHVVTEDGSIGSIRSACGVDVAQAQQTRPFKQDPKHVERRANAQLISAAPELLEALQLAASVLSGAEMTKSVLIKALEKSKTAISKALAEQI